MAARIKLADIAREAGVSVTTVSFYINGKARQYKLSRQTCERIQAAIDRNDFVPNIFARALQCNRTYLIGLLVRGRINTSFWSDIVAGLEEKLAPAGFHLVLSSAHTDAAGELEALREMRRIGVDAYVVSPALDEHGNCVNFEELQKLNGTTPVVVMNSPAEGLTCVYNDESAGGRAAAEYIASTGAERIMIFEDHVGCNFGRIIAFREFFAERGTVVEEVDSPEPVIAAAKQMKVGVFCFSDFPAASLCCRALAEGVRIGEELAVVGYDDLAFLDLLSPRPATVTQCKYELGEAIGEELLRILEQGEPDTARKIVFTPKLHR